MGENRAQSAPAETTTMMSRRSHESSRAPGRKLYHTDMDSVSHTGSETMEGFAVVFLSESTEHHVTSDTKRGESRLRSPELTSMCVGCSCILLTSPVRPSLER